MAAIGVGAAERVTSAMNILKTVRASDLKIEQRVLFTPLYSGTALQRAKSENNHGTDEVVRKNVYFLAEQLKNIPKLLIQLVQRGFLNLTERENVVKHEDEFLKCVEMLTVIIRKDSGSYKLLLEILRETGNDEVVNLLLNAVVPDNMGATASPSPVVPIRKMAPIPKTPPANVTPWNCPHCTFLNPTGNICSICSKSRILTNSASGAGGIDNTTAKKKCSACTYYNPSSAMQCEMCEQDFVMT